MSAGISVFWYQRTKERSRSDAACLAEAGILPDAQLPPRQQPVAEHVIQFVDGIDLPPRLFHRVLDAAERDLLVLENDVASPRIAVARLTHRADVDHHPVIGELIFVAA